MLRRHIRALTATPLLSLVAVLAVGIVTVELVASLVAGFVVAPLAISTSSFGELLPGFVVVGGRLVDWLAPLGAVISASLVCLAIWLVVRRRRAAHVVCPHCLAWILPEARVCFSCTRDVGETA